MFYEHRFYFETPDPQRITRGLFAIEGTVLGHEWTRVQGVPLFRCQTAQPLDENTHKRLVDIMEPIIAACNDENEMPYEKYQQWRAMQTVLDRRTLASLDDMQMRIDREADTERMPT